ncbi:phosphoenolpyruvate--protein phosphotransferase [Pontiella sulfatireligans]|uniref:phosphoenolpyruvate--protein phosphotransferase n=1 Tax=Pontiella sulfatireligans TaxID=2750658 RepID=A0A6C2ULU2_9BACT|nr:phosphoenolpyruvate--protein phosphotransferase [Pontiella sulfatireligans]VGO21088.1 Phosphoenolpyruvate-protein phosphotransferase [Pontiella sulfatireligans]
MKKRNVDLVCDIAELISLAEEGGNRKELMQSVVTSVAKHMMADVCSVYIYDEEEKKLILRATQGLDRSAIGQVKLKLGEGITGRAIRELRPICVGTASKSSSYKFFPGIHEEEYEAFLAVPILRGLRRIGVLVVQAKETNYFTPNDVKALRAIAAQLATMIENVQLLSEARLEASAPAVASVKKPTTESIIRGRSASTGTARGRAFTLDSGQSESCLLPDPDAPPHTAADFEEAIKKTARQIDKLQVQTSEKLADVAVLIFSAHLLILEDKQFAGRIADLIQTDIPALKAISIVVNEYVEIFSKSKMPLIREKVLDVKDLGNRLIRNLLNEQADECDYRGQIIIAHELLPSDILKLSAENVEGFIVSSGVTSHNAIICRSLGIPMVAVSRELADGIPDGEELLMDAEQGIIYLRPSSEVYAKYRGLDEAWKALHNASDMEEQTVTKCGERVHIFANINLLSDLPPARRFKAEGVGLYRSEFPFIVRNDFPTEEEQFAIYKKLVDQMDGRRVTFRTLDIGGDKMLSYYSNVTEANPFLGMRAIRFSLQNKDIFCHQLRAFLRAGAGGGSRIMFPLISSVDDFVAARDIVYECMDELEREGVPFSRETELGVMMELPSAVEVADELAQEADFLSIGSNDLIQYMLAVDRTNEQVSKLYLAHHPAILRAINRIVSAGITHEKDVSICGDLSADPRMLPFLLGVGLRNFSIDMVNAPTVQRLVSGIKIEDAEEIANSLLDFGRISEIEAYLVDHSLVPETEA